MIMKFRIAILDDSQMDRDSIVNIVNQHFSDEPGAVEINAFGRSDLLLLEIREGKEYDIYLLEIVLVCSASVILTSQAIQKKHSIEFHFWQGRKGQQSIAVKGFYDNYLSYCTMQS